MSFLQGSLEDDKTHPSDCHLLLRAGFEMISFSIACLLFIVVCLALTSKIPIPALIHNILISLYPVRDEDGRSIDGPAWSWPNGQTIDKFLNGRSLSLRCQEYGPLYRVWSCTTPEIVITTPEDVRVFHSDSQSHQKANSCNAGWFFHQLLGDCMGLINGNRWKKLRSLFEPHFSRQITSQRLASTNLEALVFIQQLSHDSSLGLGVSPSVIHAVTAFVKFPFFHTAEAIYGPLSGRQKEELWSIGQSRLALLRHVVKGGIHRHRASGWLARNSSKELASFQSMWKRFNCGVYDTGVISASEKPIMSAWKATISGQVSRSEVLHTLDEILFANLDVTTNVLTWLIILLAENKGEQEKLRAEIQANSACDAISYINARDSVLHFGLLEAMRLRPVTIFTIPESSPSPKKLSKFSIPAHTDVVVDTLAINVHNPFWGTDSGSFRPERFRGLKQTDLRYNFFAFGFGTRKCLGQHLAESCIKALIFQLFSKYRITVKAGEEKGPECKEDKISWVPLADVELVVYPIAGSSEDQYGQ